MTKSLNFDVKRYLPLLIIVLIISCDLFTKSEEEDRPPTITSFQPTATALIRYINDVVEFAIEASDSDKDEISYKFLKDGNEVSSTSNYSLTISEKGAITILGIAYNDLADTTAWIIDVDNQAPVVNDISLSINEEGSTEVDLEDIGHDLDGDNLTYLITSNTNNLDVKIENNKLKITGNEDYFGNDTVKVAVSDGVETRTANVYVEVVNTPDNPFADAGDDKTGTINEEITLQGEDSYHPDSPLNEIEEYSWRAINGEGNVEITDANQANAIFKALSRGNYEVELTTKDQTGLEDKDTVNVNIDSHLIAGNISELFNEGVNIAGANVAFGDANTTTDASGNYSLELALETGDARLIITHPDFYERQTSSFAPTDTTLDETMVDDDFNMEHYDKAFRFINGKTQRWDSTPSFYINTSPAPNSDGSTTPITQANVDTALSVIKDLPKFAKGLFPGDNVNIEIGTNPPAFATEGYIVLFWDNTTPGMGGHGEYLSENEINSAYTAIRTSAGRGTYVQELTQNLGARSDSNIVKPSILNEPHGGNFYFQVDLDDGEFLHSRPLGSSSPDIDP